MKAIVQARLDKDSQVALEQLSHRLGWSHSQVVREGLRLMTACYGAAAGEKIVGMGQFASRHSDLVSNRKHLAGFGR
jgi:hypothetical protein